MTDQKDNNGKRPENNGQPPQNKKPESAQDPKSEQPKRPQPLKKPANNNKLDPKVAATVGAIGLAGVAAAVFLATSGNNKGPKPSSNSGQPQSPSNPFTRATQKITKKPSHQDGRVTFDDVAGIDEVKADLQEVVDLIKNNNAERKSLGGKAPKGAMLYGDPGCGKTLIAKAIANEAGVNFIAKSGSDFVEKFVGVGASRVRSMFKDARSKAPCVLFIDEIDGVAHHRSGDSGSGGANEYNQTINALLVELDGINGRDGVFVIGATNRLDMLDPAALRPGRFDRKINVPLPDVTGREAILQVHTRNKVMSNDIDLSLIARATPRFSGADLENLANEAALLAERQQKDAIEMEDFENAKDKIMMGSGRTLKMSEKERRLTAWHEAGHALVALMEKASDPILKATILPRGGALGMVVRVPEGDQYSMNKAQMLAHLSVAAAGRAAEEVYYGDEDEITSGASSDIQQMTNIAERMIKEWGYSKELGMRNFAAKPDPATGIVSQTFSQATLQKIDEEVTALVDTSYNRAKKMLEDYRPALDAIAEALLESETLTGDEIKAIAKKAGAPVPEKDMAQPAAPKHDM